MHVFQAKKLMLFSILPVLFLYQIIPAQTRGTELLSPKVLKQWSLEELMEADITIVSKQAQRWFESPAAVKIITQEEIRRSGAKSIPEALRLVVNMNVAQFDGTQWAISARGFNDLAANKMQVLIDGRSVFNEWFSGVTWGAIDLMLESVERIEIISGPGGTLWGTNAVNGIINIITKNTFETSDQSLYAEVESEFNKYISGAIRYSGLFNENGAYKVYAKYFKKDVTPAHLDTLGVDWNGVQAGFRMDFNFSEDDKLQVQGDLYEFKSSKILTFQTIYAGGNLLSKWSHTISDKSALSIRAFFDFTKYRVFLGEDLSRGDIEFQHQTRLNNHEFSWGLGFRHSSDRVVNLPQLGFLPPNLVNNQYSAFVQDVISITRDVQLTFGSKFFKDIYSKFEFQPRFLASWHAAEHDFLWASVTRAIRKVSRFDHDYYITITPPYLIAGGPDFISENVIAYEAGYRKQIYRDFLFDLSLFYNIYNDLRSIELDLANLPGEIKNGLEAKSYGGEISLTAELTDWWEVKTGYSHLQKFVNSKPGFIDLYNGHIEGNDHKHRVVIQSLMNVLNSFEIDLFFRYVDKLPNPGAIIPSYSALNCRLGWSPNQNLDFSLLVENLFPSRHQEFMNVASSRGEEMERQIFGKISLSL